MRRPLFRTLFGTAVGFPLVLLVSTLACGEPATSDKNVASLAGPWTVRLDSEAKGLEDGWFRGVLPEGPAGQFAKVELPGSTDQWKLGTPNEAKPSLEGLYRLISYEGPAWYQRDIEIPQAWKGKRLSLFLERTHWETRVWVDGQDFGSQNSIISPHTYDLGASIAPGKHRLTVCVDNTKKLNLGWFPSILYEGTQTNWNGLIGRLELRASDPVAIDEVQVYPDVDRKLAVVRVAIANASGKPAGGTLALSAKPRGDGAQVPAKTVDFQVKDARETVAVELPMGDDVRLWDEFSPALYDLTVSLTSAEASAADSRTVAFGMRKFAIEGTRFVMNGRPLMLRGTLECGIFPLTAYPPTDVPAWQRIYRIIKSYGLNHMRFHSWCPPDAAFAAADIEGVMLQVEGPIANANDLGKSEPRDAFLGQEFLRMIRTYGNHPSFCLMTLGNEYGGPDALLSQWVEMLKKEDSRHLYCSPSCGQNTENRQFTERDIRGVQGPGTSHDFRDRLAEHKLPLIGHEIGQWTFFPNFDEIKKYTGVLAAKNFEVVRDDLKTKHMLDLAPRFFDATGHQAVLLYKEEIEVLLRTPGYAAFSLLDMHDYPGQGTALIGPLDPFWDSKGFVTPETHRNYCGPTVPLLRMEKRTFKSDETLLATAELAHFGRDNLKAVEPCWSVKDAEGREIASGALAAIDAPTGRLTELGAFACPLAKAPSPCKLTVTVSLKGTDCTNQWEIWVYGGTPAMQAPPIARRWEDARQMLATGGRALLFPERLSRTQALDGKFLPTFWSPVWFPTQKPDTMSILCDPRHPALALFPTESYSNWQWWNLLNHSQSVILDDAPADYRPIVQVIDNFARNHRLGNLFEARVGKGRLLVCTIDLPALAATDPAAEQLLSSLYRYVGSEDFQPAHELDEAWLGNLLTPKLTSLQQCGGKLVYADSAHGDFPASNAFDDDVKTIWHTPWGDGAPSQPHELQIELAAPLVLKGLAYTPRQDIAAGRIADYEVYLSDDGKQWGEQAAKGKLANTTDVQNILFEKPRKARFLRFVSLSEVRGQGYAAIAELVPLPGE